VGWGFSGLIPSCGGGGGAKPATVFISQWVPITGWQQLREKGCYRIVGFFKICGRASIKGNSIGCPVDIWIVLAEPIRSEKYIMVASVSNEKVC